MKTLVLLLFVTAPALAQTSASYKLTEAVMNAGGDPGASSLASAHFHVKLDAIGEAVDATGGSSPSFRSDAGFVSELRPPGEVTGLHWSAKTALTWSPERSIGRYEVYRDLLSALPGGAFGSCFAGDLSTETASDPASPATGQGWFYLVTARNRLREEGPKGYRSSGVEEANPAPCP
jgi:hypothetical protein